MTVLRSIIKGRSTKTRIAILSVSAVMLAAAAGLGWHVYDQVTTKSAIAYFDNTNGLFVGDRVKMLGVDIGSIDAIDPRGDRMRVKFHYDSDYRIPAQAKAVVLAQSLISARAIQLTPAYTGGPELPDGAEIPLERTAVPVEWDDLRKQLQSLAESINPTEQNKAGALGDFVNSAANALSGRGDQINDTLTKLSNAMSTLSDGRDDLFATLRNLQAFMTALSASDTEIVRLNQNVASVSSALDDSDQELGRALQSVDAMSSRLEQFVTDNRDGATKSVEDLAAVTKALNDVRPNIEQLLHVAPTAIQNFYNIYNPAQGSFTGALAVTQFRNPVQFICGAIQSASQLGAAEAAKLCVSQLAPVLRLLTMNYPPAGINPVSGLSTRPEQIDYSEQWLRGAAPAPTATQPVDAAAGLPGLLGIPNQGGGR
ncbi:MCE family protein [Nocardia sp. NBC_00565]|uniref:MCE family protein n=1 Tax=Nocardia sp. NBC_00565 TaxID=2975993 RepID=UPI002E7FCFFA|nr:MCE family protein [Nocardia sp. NBC_00565]WUC06696.1 MCE family protein [Nocardia sp. NBC_00565]